MENRNRADIGRLIKMALVRFGAAFVIISLIFFLTAGTFEYINGWLFLGALFIPVMTVTIYLAKNDPELLLKRMKSKEKEAEQRLIIKLSYIPFSLALIIPGLDYRYNWSDIPLWLVIFSIIIMLTGYGMFFLVIRQNSYASRVVEIQDEQKLIEDGLYSVVRHPMYLSNVIMYISIPLVLGSWWALIPMSLFAFVFYYRIRNEEEVLKVGLPGYHDYMKKVRFRLIPYIW